VKTLFLVNTRSGPRRRLDLPALIRANVSTPHELRGCERKEDLDTIVEDAERDGFDVVYAVGGDGTVHEVAKRLIGRRPALGILPTGSGNGFARHIGLPMEPGASLRACGGRRIVTIDTAAVNGVPFLGVLGAGFDALIAHRFAESQVRGFRTYARIGFGAFFSYHAEEVEIVVDGEPLRQRVFTVVVANSSQFGNDATIAPSASVTDGLLDVVVIGEVGFWGACALLPRLLRRTIDRSKHVTILRGRHIEIRRPTGGPVHLDGEPFTFPPLLSVHVKPASLRVLLPDACGAV
jgi:YegS/Rv2252/BmrU family lipid kinase